jgi:hypothetical protein
MKLPLLQYNDIWMKFYSNIKQSYMVLL